jgi:Adenylate and Guanylate cyclase catalytic domain
VLCLAINQTRPCTVESETLVARARTLNSGPTFTLAEVLVEDARGRAVAHGTGTYVIRPIQPPPPPHAGPDVAVERPAYPTPDPSERPLSWSPRDVMFDEIAPLELFQRGRPLECAVGGASRHRAQATAGLQGAGVKTTGDGFLATFDSPGRGVQCARAIRDGVRRLGLEVRAGLHTGECEVSGVDVAGIAIHVASRIQSAAGPGEILVSNTVRNLVAGSGLQLSARGVHEFKGLEGKWQLFAPDS